MAKKKSDKTPGAVDAIELLIQDHINVKDLFDQYQDLADDNGDDGEKLALAQRICAELTVHAQIEEEIFYPAAREAIEEQNLLDEAEVEHASAKDLIAQIESMSPGEDLYDAKVKVLGEYIDHHVKEEQDEMFPKVRKSDLDTEALGTELMDRKLELMNELGLEDEDEESEEEEEL